VIVQVLGVSPNVRRVLEGIAKSQFPRGFQKWRPTSEAFYFRLPAYNPLELRRIQKVLDLWFRHMTVATRSRSVLGALGGQLGKKNNGHLIHCSVAAGVFNISSMSDPKYSFQCLCGKCGFTATGAPVKPHPPAALLPNCDGSFMCPSRTRSSHKPSSRRQRYPRGSCFTSGPADPNYGSCCLAARSASSL